MGQGSSGDAPVARSPLTPHKGDAKWRSHKHEEIDKTSNEDLSNHIFEMWGNCHSFLENVAAVGKKMLSFSLKTRNLHCEMKKMCKELKEKIDAVLKASNDLGRYADKADDRIVDLHSSLLEMSLLLKTASTPIKKKAPVKEAIPPVNRSYTETYTQDTCGIRRTKAPCQGKCAKCPERDAKRHLELLLPWQTLKKTERKKRDQKP